MANTPPADWNPLAGHPWVDNENRWIGPAEFEMREFFLAYVDAAFNGDDWLDAFILLNTFHKPKSAAATPEGA